VVSTAMVEVIDPTHALYGLRLPLHEIVHHSSPLGHTCAVELSPGIVRLIPVAATDLGGVRRPPSPCRLSVAAVRSLLLVVTSIGASDQLRRESGGSPATARDRAPRVSTAVAPGAAGGSGATSEAPGAGVLVAAEREAVVLLDTIPGVSQRTAEVLLAELGSDLSRFPSAGHLASWAGMCPGNDQSGGKRFSGKTRKGHAWLRRTLVEIAHVAAKTKETYLAAQYRRIAARRGKKRALLAVGHRVLVMIYHILTKRTPYRELGGTSFDARERDRVQRHLVHRLERLGFAVTLTHAPALS
jgi:Transposase IS116/IS110/IS902 family